ncbi:fasciclin domain-containing protein [soil metagenome]
MKSIKNVALFVAATFLSINVMAQTNKDIVDIAAGSDAHTTLVAAVKAADLVATLKSKGPFTVFAPTNDAFAKLPAGTVDNLLMAENKAKLAGILTYHVVAGNLDAKAVLAAIKKGGGKVVLTTVAGGKLTASVEMGKVVLTDENGGKATVTATDLKATNGVIHVIDSVLLPG